MEEKDPICPNCKQEVSRIAVDCENCKFPLSGTAKEKAIFIGQQTLNKSKIDNSAQVIRRTQIILYVIAGLKVLSGILSYIQYDSVFDLIFFLVIAAILATFGFLMPKKPVLFIVLSLGVLLLYYTLLFLIDPMLIFRGILWKFAFVGALLYALYTVVESQKLKKKFNL